MLVKLDTSIFLLLLLRAIEKYYITNALSSYIWKVSLPVIELEL